jgi:VWFA-related protein
LTVSHTVDPLRLAALLAAGALICGPGPGAAQQQDSRQSPPQPSNAPQQPIFRTGVDLVRLDAIVTDRRGQPVDDLRAEDFEIFENGARQQIASFSFVAAAGGEPGEPLAPVRNDADVEAAVAQGARLFLIFLDEYHVLRGRNTLVTREALASFVRGLGPADLVAVMYPFTSIRDLGFTRDKEAIAGEIMKFEGRADDFMPKRPMEAEHWRDVRRIRNEVVLTALAAAAMHMETYGAGRKTIVLASEGLNPGGWRELGQFYTTVRDVTAAANRTNTAIYPMDPTGLTFNSRGATDVLRVLAGETSGEALVNRNDVEKALQRVVRDASAYYLIGYQPATVVHDGKWREIEVKVRRPGVEVRARKGYAALSAAEHATSLVPIVEPSPEALAALSRLASPREGRMIATWLGYEMQEPGPPRVRFVWERGGLSAPGAPRVTLTARGSDGTPYFRGVVGDAKPDGEPAADGAPGGQVVFDAPTSGTLTLDVVASTPGGDHSQTLSVEIPDARGAPIAIDTPRVIRTSSPIEHRRARDDRDARPTTAREFRRSDRLLIRFGTYGSGAGSAIVSATLLNRRGEPLADLPQGTRAVGPARYEIDLPLANFAAGEFILRIDARAGSAEASELIALRIS